MPNWSGHFRLCVKIGKSLTQDNITDNNSGYVRLHSVPQCGPRHHEMARSSHGSLSLYEARGLHRTLGDRWSVSADLRYSSITELTLSISTVP
jgi:hypothetical protein